jgi:tyrosyl-tRNA synthetase
LFGTSDPTLMSSTALAALAGEVPFVELPAPEGGELDTLELFSRALPDAIASRGAARRLLEQGGLSVNGARLGAADKTIALDRLLGDRYLLLRKGARDWAVARVAEGRGSGAEGQRLRMPNS